MAFGKIIQSESLINFAVWLDRIQSRDRYPRQRHNNFERKQLKVNYETKKRKNKS
jgi:hypothetical protein